MDGRSPQGERGLKWLYRLDLLLFAGRSPQGERGLKYLGLSLTELSQRSLPAGGAWIEIFNKTVSKGESYVAPRRGSVD